MKTIYKFMWDLSEYTGISLGVFAPYVLDKILGTKPIKIKEVSNEIQVR